MGYLLFFQPVERLWYTRQTSCSWDGSFTMLRSGSCLVFCTSTITSPQLYSALCSQVIARKNLLYFWRQKTMVCPWVAFVNNREGMSVPSQMEVTFKMGYIVSYCMCTESMHHDQSAAFLVEVRSFSEMFYRLLVMYDSFWDHLKYTIKSYWKLPVRNGFNWKYNSSTKRNKRQWTENKIWQVNIKAKQKFSWMPEPSPNPKY